MTDDNHYFFADTNRVTSMRVTGALGVGERAIRGNGDSNRAARRALQHGERFAASLEMMTPSAASPPTPRRMTTAPSGAEKAPCCIRTNGRTTEAGGKSWPLLRNPAPSSLVTSEGRYQQGPSFALPSRRSTRGERQGIA